VASGTVGIGGYLVLQSCFIVRPVQQEMGISRCCILSQSDFARAASRAEHPIKR
jgi:hypothetical protein